MGETHGSDIKTLSTLLKDEEKVREIGSEIVKLAISNAAEEKMGLRLRDAMVERTVNVGDPVPEDLIGRVQLDRAGNAAAGWRNSWLNLGIWTRSWSDSSSMGRDIRVGTFLPEALTARVSDVRLEPEELRILKDLGIRPGVR
ncbi:MAG: hypothetical protein R6U70_09985 [Bacillota bacterium]